MVPWLSLVWLLFLLALMVWAASVSLASVLTGYALTASSSPSTRARRALLIAAMPWVAPLTAVGSVCLLAAAKPLGWIADHCIYHGPGHPHLCFEHLPALGLNQLHALGAGLALLCAALVLARFLKRERRMTAHVNALHALSNGGDRVRVLEDDRAIAFAAGLATPFVLVSQGLLRRLAPRECRIVLAHEVAHIRNGDLKSNLVFEILLLLHPFWTARTLRTVWRQALEERADDRVATRFGAEDVAAVLLKVLRLATPDASLRFSAVGADPARRVARLLSPDELPSRWGFEIGYGASLLAGAVVVAGAHHALETLLGRLAGA